MQYTDVYNLKKPDLNDLPTIKDINENMEVIEEALPSYIKVLHGETVPTSRIPGKYYLISLDETNTNYRVEDSEGNTVHSETNGDLVITDMGSLNEALADVMLTVGANDENAVHKTGDESIDGVKTFTSMLKVSQGTLQVGSDDGYSVTYDWKGSIVSKQPSGTHSIYLPNANGTLAIDENLVHTSGDETIDGTKIFLNDIFRKNTSVDLTVTPPGYTNTNIIFADKNDKTLAYIEYVQRPSGVNDVGIFANDKNGNAHGIHINTNNEVIPLLLSSEPYSLGSATHKWANVYATTFYGDLKGNADNGVDSRGGSWIRFKNGIQMCWGIGTFEEMISYPVAFNSGPRLICTPFSDAPQSLVVNICLKTNTLFACRLWNVHTQGWQTNGYFDWIAIGTWY